VDPAGRTPAAPPQRDIAPTGGGIRFTPSALRHLHTTLRNAKTATVNDWGAVLWYDGKIHEAIQRTDLEILDRVGGGDSFASGLIYGFLTGKTPEQAVNYGAAHGALAMTTPGDTTMATLPEVERVMRGGAARVSR